jgi:hypothetical protein
MVRLGTAWLFGALVVVGVFALGLAAFPELVLAGPVPPNPGPVPLIGVGLPIAGAVVATVLVALRFRRKD